MTKLGTTLLWRSFTTRFVSPERVLCSSCIGNSYSFFYTPTTTNPYPEAAGSAPTVDAFFSVSGTNSPKIEPAPNPITAIT